MSELRLTGKTPDGVHLALTDQNGAEFSLRISDTLRATVNQPRLTSVPVGEENEAMSVKDDATTSALWRNYGFNCTRRKYICRKDRTFRWSYFARANFYH